MTDLWIEVPCPDCAGEGWVEVMKDVDKGYDAQCERCDGSGVISVEIETETKKLTGENENE